MSAAHGLGPRQRPDQNRILKSASLARAAPREWVEFVAEMKIYADEEARRCIESSPDQLQRLQGRAQLALEFVALFEGAVKSADRIASIPAGTSAAVTRR